MTKSAICAATFVGLFSTSAIAQTEAEFQQLEDTFTAAFNKEDVSTIADMFAENSYLLPNNGDFIQGRAAIRSFWESNVKTVKHLKLTTKNVQSLKSDAALEIGTSSNTTNGQRIEGST